jgi:hypothetical protein
MNSTAFSLLANSNPEVDESQEMELTIESLSFYIGPSGSTLPSDPTKSGPSASKTERITISGSSVGSSSEVNSPVSLTATKYMQEKLEEFDETRGKPDMEATAVKTHDSSRDFAIESSGISRSVHQLCVIITEALAEGALGPGAADGTLGLFLLPAGRPGRRFTGADDEATAVAIVALFLLPRGRPRPRLSIRAPMFRRDPPASAIELRVGKKKP